MTLLFCSVVGALFAISIYLILSSNLLQWLLGIALLSSSVNLVILMAGRLSNLIPPFIPSKALTAIEGTANPLPQALILTAIIIGFGLLVFALVLVRQIWLRTGTTSSELLMSSETLARTEKIS